MAWLRALVAIIFTGVLVAAASAQTTQGRRVALVIGNSAYAAQGTLANPGPDSRLVADALRRAGFTVVAQNNLGKQTMERALRDFSRQADGAEVALVYYAGHGLEANGVNWLLPVDAQLADERDLSFEAISLDTVLGTVERARGLRMVVLDACRNNPFARSMRRSATTRATVARGLADVEVTGTLVFYAARGGTVAQDGPSGGNSPFATAFARRVPEPGVDIRLLVSKVRDDVLAATGRAQEPFSYGSLPGVDLALTPAVQRPPNSPVGGSPGLQAEVSVAVSSADRQIERAREVERLARAARDRARLKAPGTIVQALNVPRGATYEGEGIAAEEGRPGIPNGYGVISWPKRSGVTQFTYQYAERGNQSGDIVIENYTSGSVTYRGPANFFDGLVYGGIYYSDGSVYKGQIGAGGIDSLQWGPDGVGALYGADGRVVDSGRWAGGVVVRN